MHYLDFEKQIAILANKIEDLKNAQELDVDINTEINQLQRKYNDLLRETYKSLNPWQKVAVARHPERPHSLDYIEKIITNFIPIHGDRLFAEDKALIAGFGRLNGKSVAILGIEKGHDLETRIKHNFGMPKPEGYRKAQRLMLLADRLKLPIITFVDTSGAYPGQEAEERGQGEAIAKSIAVCLQIYTPLICVIIGEGGSGGAIAIAAGDKVLMLENSVYSIISPEGCASILWRNDAMAEEAAKALCLTSEDLKKFEIIDTIIPEGLGGAHRNKEEVFNNVKQALDSAITSLSKISDKERKDKKHKRYLNFGKLA